MKKWYVYTFEDGYVFIAGKLSKKELAWEEYRHGKCVSITDY